MGKGNEVKSFTSPLFEKRIDYLRHKSLLCQVTNKGLYR